MGEIFRKVMVKVMKIDLRAERARKRAQEGSEVAEENESEETEASVRKTRTLGDQLQKALLRKRVDLWERPGPHPPQCQPQKPSQAELLHAHRYHS